MRTVYPSSLLSFRANAATASKTAETSVISVKKGIQKRNSEFNMYFPFLANRAPNISTYKETVLQTHQRCKDIYVLISEQAN